MRYYNSIVCFFILSICIVISLLYFANITRNIEKENKILKSKINFLKDQVNINEIEYSLHSSYENLQKLQKIYFKQKTENFSLTRISYFNLKNKNIENFYEVGIK